jgi:ectoine hydroxylase-related dioxygenase (phytanoyl-CoA dioxygenase family)
MTDDQIRPWLRNRSLDSWREEFDEQGYLIFESVLPAAVIDSVRAALRPYLEREQAGRNNFEGHKSNRIYALLNKSPVFAELVAHPLALAFAEADLGRSCLLSACLAIQLNPGETVQPWHYDDSHLDVPRPRPSWGVSTFWSIDATTAENGATEILPGSHRWPENRLAGASAAADFINITAPGEPTASGSRPDAVKALMPPGSLMITKGTLWHRGGANNSDQPRLIVTPQYCPGWARQLENICMGVSLQKTRALPERVRELMGYSIHGPFMGYVDGMHPKRVLATE